MQDKILEKVFFVLFALTYIIFSILTGQFNISNWNVYVRATFFSLLVALISLFIILKKLDDDVL